MPERLPNTGEDNWQDILGANDGAGGYLRVAHNDDGSEKWPGTSYLYATPVDQTGIVNSITVSLSFTLDEIDGSDYAIDGGDATKINVLTDSWVTLGWYFDIYAETDNLTAIILNPTLNGVNIWPGWGKSTRDMTALEMTDIISVPAFPVSAGDHLGADVQATTIAGTWAISSGATRGFQVIRVS